MNEKTLEELAAEAAAADAAEAAAADAAEAAAADAAEAAAAAAAEESKFQRAQSDPAIVSRAGIINGMNPAEVRARILAAAG